MHPSLGLQNILQLAPAERILATSAVHGSGVALLETFDLIVDPEFRLQELLAPVFFVNLHPSGIPQQLSDIQPDIDSPIARAVVSLRSLPIRSAADGSAIFAQEALPDVWPRVWKWIQFLDKHGDRLAISNVESYSLYCEAISTLQMHADTKKLIYDTPGVHVVMARAWATFVGKHCTPEQASYVGLCRFLLEDTPSFTTIEEFVQGAGGSQPDLARLMVAHLKLFIPRHDFPISNETLTLIRPVVQLFKAINSTVDLWNSELFSQGIVRALVFIMRSLTLPSSADDKEEVADDCFIILIRLLILTRQHKHIADAVQFGLLHAIALSPTATVSVKCLLTLVLPRATAYYSVLQQVRKGLEEVEDITRGSDFWASDKFEFWTKFMEVVEHRLEVLRRYEQGDWLSGRHCDNLDCGKRMRTAEQSRCSGCGTSYYCSKECQASDWQKGGHRKVCTRLKALLLNDPETVTARDRSFMWALAHFDYLTNKPALYVERISVMNNYPGEVVFSVLDYTSGAVEPGVRILKALPPSEVTPSFRALWDEGVVRAARSGGRIHLVILRMPEGHACRNRLLNMQSDTSAINDGLEAIARSIPPKLGSLDSKYSAVVGPKIQALLREDGCSANVTF
ncbi:hypothetical protein C8F04DRAFT_101331 [Mycena alexandri]|uniref:MYND-type domain-containing protein n=1 Tax=Mycena alexandri TaxID=1745969 RepID=A0AAD6SF92_9AGAR|nr:hypothetical protein C8F04DRAFT_101331 [Mycena alexandri]